MPRFADLEYTCYRAVGVGAVGAGAIEQWAPGIELLLLPVTERPNNPFVGYEEGVERAWDVEMAVDCVVGVQAHADVTDESGEAGGVFGVLVHA